jgi:hypothetical protein
LWKRQIDQLRLPGIFKGTLGAVTQKA